LVLTIIDAVMKDKGDSSTGFYELNPIKASMKRSEIKRLAGLQQPWNIDHRFLVYIFLCP